MSVSPPSATSTETPTPGTPTQFPAAHEESSELQSLQREWLWFLGLGVALITLGAVAIGSAFFVSIVTVVMFGVLMLIGGVVQIVNAFWVGKWSGFLMHLLMGFFYVVVGGLIIDSPLASAMALTLMVSAFLIVAGIFRIVSAMVLRFQNWGWPLLNGLVTLLLGILILKQWPVSGLWAIGLFVGIEMIFNGWSWLMLSLDLRRIGKRQMEESLTQGGVI